MFCSLWQMLCHPYANTPGCDWRKCIWKLSVIASMASMDTTLLVSTAVIKCYKVILSIPETHRYVNWCWKCYTPLLLLSFCHSRCLNNFKSYHRNEKPSASTNVVKDKYCCAKHVKFLPKIGHLGILEMLCLLSKENWKIFLLFYIL